MHQPKNVNLQTVPVNLPDTNLNFNVVEITGGIWVCAPVSERPEIVLTDWHVFEVQLPGQSDRTRHFAGQNATDIEGRASSAIVRLDAVTRRGITSSGRVYELRGGTGFTPDGQYTWNAWKRINRATDVVDVTPEIIELLEQL